MVKVEKLSSEIVFLSDFDKEAKKLSETWGKTDLHSFGEADLDKYFGGGYGRRNGYEIVLLFGGTGIGKSTFALNMMIEPLLKGAEIGLLVLEDDGADVNLKMKYMMGEEDFKKYGRKIHFTPTDVVDGSKMWGLDELLLLIEKWFDRGIDIILLDHLQFAFESAISLKGENEYINQRVFVRKLNYLIRKYKKTIILVSHINKSNLSKGMNKIVGSGGIAGSATKVIEISKDENVEGVMLATYHKSRFTATPNHPKSFQFGHSGKILR